MIGHDKSRDDFAIHDVAFHDLSHVGFRCDPIPDTLRINHHARSERAMIETTGLVGPYGPFQVQPLRFLFEDCVERLRSLGGTTAPRVVLRPLVDTNEDVMFKCRQRVPYTQGETGAD